MKKTDATRDFLSSFVKTARQYEADIKADAILCRSQRGHSYRPVTDDHGNEVMQEPCPLPATRMKPVKGRACEGRINPKGIPYLYLSNDENTALAEVRPWLHELVSLGYFKVLRDLRLVHFTEETKSTIVYLSTPPHGKIDGIVWRDINRAFSRPVTNDDALADYVPTQLLAEAIKKEGYDGIVYKSLLGKGLNIALFDPDLVRLVKRSLFTTDNIEYCFSEAANPYYCPDE